MTLVAYYFREKKLCNSYCMKCSKQVAENLQKHQYKLIINLKKAI